MSLAATVKAMAAAGCSTQDEEAGEIVCGLLRRRQWIDHAPTMHADVIADLQANGFCVWPEWSVIKANGKAGRIDIVADHACGGRVAIELDCRKPRRKSIEKLTTMSCFRVIGLRGIEGHHEPGIHACIAMRVRFADAGVKADRRIYRSEPEWSQDWKGAA